ncbi:hypothetical protein REC12_01910 [Desulfosporosinus sp. PR]|uniref:hypothetical protein n=1 Tax=Candidatus Desulfosporosinus nitrosoreducens TaxID=3401928 RepID=UPI0027E715EC|nr:hypothetical protein [Desulfosporosinus sp. PR]MDQ7092347.1 hypothetical protein [Desulfosporosinus sp. PR]
MELLTLWTIVILLLTTIWIGMARETRLASGGYILQMLFILILYARNIEGLRDPLLWLSWAGMAIIRLIGVPLIIRHYLPTLWWKERVMQDLLNPQGAAFLFGILAATGFFTGSFALSSPLAGGVLGMLLVGLAIVLLKHDPSKQIFGLLTADNSVDLILINLLDKTTLDAELAIYTSVFLAVFCLVLLARILHYRSDLRSTRELSQLRG